MLQRGCFARKRRRFGGKLSAVSASTVHFCAQKIYVVVNSSTAIENLMKQIFLRPSLVIKFSFKTFLNVLRTSFNSYSMKINQRLELTQKIKFSKLAILFLIYLFFSNFHKKNKYFKINPDEARRQKRNFKKIIVEGCQ